MMQNTAAVIIAAGMIRPIFTKELLSQLINYISFGAFGLNLFCKYFFRAKIWKYYQEKDSQYSGGIIPNRTGILYVLAFFLPFSGMLLSTSLYHGFPEAWGGLLVFVMGCGVIAIFIYKDQMTSIRIKGDMLYVRVFKKEEQYPISNIQSVTWGSGGITGNRYLSITFYAGAALSFAQEFYWGLENTARTLQKKNAALKRNPMKKLIQRTAYNLNTHK